MTETTAPAATGAQPQPRRGAAELVSPVQALTAAPVVSSEVYQTLATTAAGIAADISGTVSAAPGAAVVATESGALAAQEQIAGLASRQGFRVAGVGMVIDYIDASELLEVPPISYVPNTPHWYAGVVNLHGSVVPVLDLQRYLNLEDSPQAVSAGGRNGMENSGSMMLVLGHNEDALGIFVDGLPARVYLDMAKGSPDVALAPGQLTAYTRAVHHVDGEMWCELDCTRLLDDIEQQLQSRSGG